MTGNLVIRVAGQNGATATRNRKTRAVFSDFALSVGTDAGLNILKAFWPSMRKRVSGKRTNQLRGLVIGTKTLDTGT